MTSITTSTRQVRAAGGLPGLLTATWIAFEDMIAEIEARQDPDSPMFEAFVMAGAFAADGRDAVLAAPSLPWPPQDCWPGGGAPGPADETAAAGVLAALCQVLTSRLEAAAASGVIPADRDACRRGARCARAIGDLLTGAGR
jgi:hypothetical protein